MRPIPVLNPKDVDQCRAAAEVVTVELRDGGVSGRGECVPYVRYGETVDSVVGLIEATCAGSDGGEARAKVAAMPAAAPHPPPRARTATPAPRPPAPVR